MVVAFIAYFQRLFTPLTQLTSLASLYSQGGAALDKINALLDEKPTIVERAGRDSRTARARSAWRASPSPTTASAR